MPSLCFFCSTGLLFYGQSLYVGGFVQAAK